MSRLIIKSPYLKSGGKAGGYLNYIATRDGVEPYMNYIAGRKNSHGLFGDEDVINLDSAKAELTEHQGRIWTHIMSLRGEDAVRLGYDNANSWRNLLKSHRNDIAEAMKISPENFRWYAAFHNEPDHPHVHMMAWSADSKHGYLSRTGINYMKSVLTNDIFKQEMLFLFKEKSQSRDQLVQQARDTISELAHLIKTSQNTSPELETLMLKLALRLESVRGKKQYGYLPKDAKLLVDEIVKHLETLPSVAHCYAEWWKLNEQIRTYYSGEPRDCPPLCEQKEFRSVKNAVVREAAALSQGQSQSGISPVAVAIGSILLNIAAVFTDNSAPRDSKHNIRIDSKRRRKLQEKKQALGHAWDDQDDSPTMY